MSESPKENRGNNEFTRRQILAGIGAVGIGGLAPRSLHATSSREKTSETFEIKRVTEYIKRIHALSEDTNSILYTGSPEDIVKLFRMDVEGDKKQGERPIIAPFGGKASSVFYPHFTTEYLGANDKKGWPALQILLRNHRTQEEDEWLPTNAIRTGLNRVKIPQFAAWRVAESAGITDTSSSSGTVSNLIEFSLQLQGEHVKAPVLSSVPEVSSDKIGDGVYAVALGKGSSLEDTPNSDEASGAYRLTGFLVRIKDKPALRNLFEEWGRKNISVAKHLDEYMHAIDTSYAMACDSLEWGDLYARTLRKEDGYGQPVYVNVDGKGFQRMGVMHYAIGLTPDGKMMDILRDEETGLRVKPGQTYAPIGLVTSE